MKNDLIIATNLAAFESAIALRHHQTGEEVRTILIEEGRLLSLRLIRLTPPKTQAEGRRAIEGDLQRSIYLMEPGDFRNSELRRLARAKDYDAINAIFRGEGGGHWNVKGVDWEFLRFSPSLHTEAQNKRKRVRRSTGKRTLDRPAWNRHRVKLQRGVGRAKGGWAKAHIQLGGKAPQWIARHANAGYLVDHSMDEKDPYLEFINESGWAESRGGSKAADTVINTAYASRARNIAQKIAKESKLGLARELGKASAAALKAIGKGVA